jgi:integrase
MATKLTPALVAGATGPADGRAYNLIADSEVIGLGLRTTKSGAKAWTFSYRTHSGISRRLTIGNVADWPLKLARDEARRLRRLVDTGHDPMGDRHEFRAAPIVADLVARWRTDAAPKKRPRSLVDDESMIAQYILPALGRLKVADVRHADIDKLHRKITSTGAKVRANRVIALLGRMFSLAVIWEMRSDSPVKGIERNPETARHRYLEGDELERLIAAVAAQSNRQGAHVIELLLLTGARRSEVLQMRWDQLDLANGVWTKPASATKQARLHRIPLSAPARQVLVAKAAKYRRDVPAWVFPARYGGGPLSDVKHVWIAICRTAGITDLHLHDLRHAYATILASAGLSLPIIGRLLGHSQASTTNRYAHLMDDPLRAATDRVGAIVTAAKTGQTGEVVPLPPKTTGDGGGLRGNYGRDHEADRPAAEADRATELP